MNLESKGKQYLQKILESNEFSESKSYAELLSYLVESSLNGQSPKEATISMEVFHKDLHSDMGSDSNVRVYIHNLRKKLDSYYLNEGKEDTVRLSIPKGRYGVKFSLQDNRSSRINIKKLLVINALLLILIILINNYYLRNNNSIEEKIIPANSPVWTEFFQSNKPTMIVIGDWYVYNDYSVYENNNDSRETKSDVLMRHRYVRDPGINSDRDLDEFLTQHNSVDLNVRKTEHTMLGKFAAWCMYEILPIFIYQGIKVDIKLSSKLLWEDFNNYNTVYIGSYKSFGLIKNIVQNLNTKYKVFPNSIDFYDAKKNTTFSYQSFKEYDSGYHEDYTLIAKIPGPNQNTIVIFAATGDLGHMSSVKHFTVLETLNEFETKYMTKNDNPQYFEAIMEVKGFERTQMVTRLLHFRTIPSNYSIAEPE